MATVYTLVSYQHRIPLTKPSTRTRRHEPYLCRGTVYRPTAAAVVNTPQHLVYRGVHFVAQCGVPQVLPAAGRIYRGVRMT